jgi:hypothetical protein
MANEFYNANLAFILSYTDGTKEDEIEYELYKVFWQSEGLVHYDRENGGGFEDLEQDPDNSVNILLFVSNLLKTVYRVNAKKNYDPYIVVSYNDIAQKRKDEKLLITVGYRLLQDLKTQGNIEEQIGG